MTNTSQIVGTIPVILTFGIAVQAVESASRSFRSKRRTNGGFF